MGIHKTRPAPDPVRLQHALQHADSPSAASITHYTCKLVTPMYGGGVHAGVVDAAMPIRATAIRGQLREWWRRLNGKADGKARDPKALFEAERAIWGGLGDADEQTASKVAVQVLVKQAPTAMLASYKTYPGYVLFPAAPDAKKGKPEGKLLKEGWPFVLTLRVDASLSEIQRNQVHDAVRWWATFGGVGGRTRRGCGAVEVADEGRHLLTVSKEEVAARGWMLVTRNTRTDALAAWIEAVEQLRDFRQKPGFARNKGTAGPNNPGGNRPGRSRWPEPDAIRRITGAHASQHNPEHPAGNVFPRAAFGLPIIFQFKDAGDPGRDNTLKPIPNGSGQAAERMASPLIVRPYSGGNGWQPAVLCLDRSHIARMAFSLEGKARGLSHKITTGEWQAGAHASEIKPLNGHADAIEAFLQYFAISQPSVGSHSAPQAPSRTLERPNIRKQGQCVKVEPKGQAPRMLDEQASKRLMESLSDYARQRLDTGKPFNRLSITFDDHYNFQGVKEYVQ